VEVRDDELGVTELEVDCRSVQQHPGQPAEQERHKKPIENIIGVSRCSAWTCGTATTGGSCCAGVPL